MPETPTERNRRLQAEFEERRQRARVTPQVVQPPSAPYIEQLIPRAGPTGPGARPLGAPPPVQPQNVPLLGPAGPTGAGAYPFGAPPPVQPANVPLLGRAGPTGPGAFPFGAPPLAGRPIALNAAQQAYAARYQGLANLTQQQQFAAAGPLVGVTGQPQYRNAALPDVQLTPGGQLPAGTPLARLTAGGVVGPTPPPGGYAGGAFGIEGVLSEAGRAYAARYTGLAVEEFRRTGDDKFLPNVISTDVANELPQWRREGAASADAWLRQLGYYEFSPGQWEKLVTVTAGGGGFGGGRGRAARVRGAGGRRAGGAATATGLINWRIGP